MFRRLLLSIIVFMLAIGLLQVKNKVVGQSTVFDESRNIKRMVDATVLIRGDYIYGNGVFIADDIILTAGHILTDSNFVVKLSNGTKLKIKDFYIDEKEDVGFVFIDADELHISRVTVMPGNVGDVVYLVGTPYSIDFEFSITKGILSHLDRDAFGRKDLLQTDAEAAPGSSGGPLYNIRGEVIGICITGPNPGGGVTLCESGKSILEAYERCLGKEYE